LLDCAASSNLATRRFEHVPSTVVELDPAGRLGSSRLLAEEPEAGLVGDEREVEDALLTGEDEEELPEAVVEQSSDEHEVEQDAV